MVQRSDSSHQGRLAPLYRLLSYLEPDLRAQYLPWLPKRRVDWWRFELRKAALARRAGATHFGAGAYISPGAQVFTDSFEIGSRSWVARGALLRGELRIGSDTTINAYAHVAGKVTIGDGVRIASAVQIVGFNHAHADPDIEIFRQGITSEGITIADGCWIGASAVILDGARVGAHSIVAAGAVVTRDVPPYSVVGGVPAKVVRMRH